MVNLLLVVPSVIKTSLQGIARVGVPPPEGSSIIESLLKDQPQI